MATISFEQFFEFCAHIEAIGENLYQPFSTLDTALYISDFGRRADYGTIKNGRFHARVRMIGGKEDVAVFEISGANRRDYKLDEPFCLCLLYTYDAPDE